MKTLKELQNLFQSLSDENRLRILNALSKSKNGLCVCELVEILNLPQYAVSRALGKLKDTNLVVFEKKSQLSIYKINNDNFNKHLFNFLKKLFELTDFQLDEKKLKKILEENSQKIKQKNLSKKTPERIKN